MGNSSRLYAYDVVRVIAMVFVIAVHSLIIVDTSTTFGAIFFSAGQAVFFTANALFFLLSGKFNLHERKTDSELGGYYVRRARNFLLPIVILFFIRTLYELYPHYESTLHIGKEFVKNSICNFNSMEYWFVFTLFGYLLVAPFLAPAFNRLSNNACKAFLGIGLGYHLILLVSSNLGIEFSWSYLFWGFAFVFCAGAFVERLFETKRQRTALIAFAVISAILTTVFPFIGWWSGIHDTSPFYTILALGLFVGIAHAAQNAKPRKAISYMAKHSFSVYLVHMMILTPVVAILPAFSGIGSIAAYIGVVAVTFLLSLALAIVIDAALVKPAQKLFDIAAGAIAKAHNKRAAK